MIRYLVAPGYEELVLQQALVSIEITSSKALECPTRAMVVEMVVEQRLPEPFPLEKPLIFGLCKPNFWWRLGSNQCIVGVVQLHVDGGTWRVAPGIDESLLGDAIGSELNNLVERQRRPAKDETSTRSGRIACLVARTVASS